MKNILLLLVILLPFLSHAQDRRGNRSTALLTKEEAAPEVLLGTITTANSSRELVLLNPRLIAQQEDCAVTGYTFSITSGSKSWGPVTVTGPKLSDEIKDKIVDWDPNNVTVTFDNIHLNCNGQEATAHSIILKYDH